MVVLKNVLALFSLNTLALSFVPGFHYAVYIFSEIWDVLLVHGLIVIV